MVWFEAFLCNLELSHPGAMDLLKKGIITVTHALIPGLLCAADKMMEETFMKFTKSSGRFYFCFAISIIILIE